jgi:CHRD domain
VRNLLNISIGVSIVLLCELIYSNPIVFAENVDRFWSVLTGQQQVPPNNTNAVGYVGFKFADDPSRLVYNVNVDDIRNITSVYLYDQNGTMILDLLEEAKELKNDDINIIKVTEHEIEGTLAVGGVTSDDLQGKLKGKSLSDLRKMIMEEQVYVSILTKAYPHGEIRGNEFIPIDRALPDISDFHWD